MENKKDIFAPPTKEELDMFAPPTPEELSAIQPTQEGISKLQSFLRGGAQGISFGTADEIAAGLESAITPKTFNQALEESRQAYKAAEEANPLTYTSGEIASAIPTSALAGAGIAKIATSLPKVAKLAQLAAKYPKLTSIGKLGTAGALEGAAYGAGQAEDDRLKGAIEGATSGGLTGALFGAGGEALKGLSKAENLPESFYDVKKAFKMGQEGVGITGKKSIEQIENRVEDAAKNVSKLLSDEVSQLGRLKDEILTKVPANKNKALELMDATLNELNTKPNLPEINTMMNVINTYANDLTSNVNPSAADLRKITGRIDSYVNQFYNKQGVVDIDSVRSFQQLSNNLKDLYRKSVDINTANKIISSSSPEIKNIASRFNKQLTGDFPIEQIDNSLHNILNVTEDIGGSNQNILKGYNEQNKAEAVDKLSRFISGKERKTETGASFRREYKRYLDNLAKHDPELAKKFAEEIQPIAEQATIARLGSSNLSVGERGSSNIPLLSTLKGLTLGSANTVGQLSSAPGELIKSTINNIPNKITIGGKQYGKNVANKLMELYNASPDKRNVMMNVLLQNPEYRQIFADLKDSDE